MKRKIILSVLICFLCVVCIGLCACGENSPANSSSESSKESSDTNNQLPSGDGEENGSSSENGNWTGEIPLS